MKTTNIALTDRQMEIIRGLIGPKTHEIGINLSRASSPDEKKFYGRAMVEFEELQNLFDENDPRRQDTSQDVDEDEEA